MREICFLCLRSIFVLRFPNRHSATKGIIIATVCTFFEIFNVPVFWPILVMYFIMLFCITMKRQIKVPILENYSVYFVGILFFMFIFECNCEFECVFLFCLTAYGQVPIFALHTREKDVQRQGGHRESLS